MILIVDDVLDAADRAACMEYFTADKLAIHWSTTSDYWQSILLAKARAVVDLSSMQGFECWAHRTTRPGWHVDKDEGMRELQTPLCSIVYYPCIENLTGGRFLTNTETVTPRTNRMIVFSPGIYHGVEEWSGTRFSVAINPWDHRPVSYS